MAQTILITGANRGIGLALTAELLKGGDTVIAAVRTPSRARELQELLETNAACLRIVELDVTSDASLAAALPSIPPLDILVNNAAVFPEEGDESIFDMDLDHFRQAYETNVVAVARITRALVPLLEKGTAPRIVNISSGAASVAGKDDHGYYAYAASKAALNMLTRGLAHEMRPRDICVVALTPGWVKTDMGGPNAPLAPEQSARAIARTILSLTMEKTSLFIERTGGEVKYGW